MILGVLQVFGLSNCASFQLAPKSDLEIIYKGNYKRLSGRFENSPMEYSGGGTSSVNGRGFTPITLWQQLTGCKHMIDTGKVTLEFNSRSRATAKLYYNDLLIESVTLKGHVHDDFFYGRVRSKVIPFFPLAFGYRSDGYRIALRDDNLVIDYRWEYSLTTLFGGSSDEGLCREVFKRQITTDSR